MERTDQQQQQPSPPPENPAIADRDATVAELHARAAQDYAEAQAYRDQLAGEDHVDDNESDA